MPSTPEQMMPVILQRLAGTLTALEAARQLGISRKTYYEWEARALRGMKAALEPNRPGRPRLEAQTALERVQAQKRDLQAQVEVLQQRIRCQEVRAEAETPAQKK